MKLNVWVSTLPSFVDICLLQPEFDATHYPILSRFLFCGEELTHRTATQLKERFRKLKSIILYGPTEATVAVASIEITQEVLKDYQRLPIGKIKSDMEIEVVDQVGRVTPGETGELVISGPSVSKVLE